MRQSRAIAESEPHVQFFISYQVEPGLQLQADGLGQKARTTVFLRRTLHPLGLVSPISSLGAWGRLFPLEPPRGLRGRPAPQRPLSPRFSTVLFLRRFSFATCHPVSLCDPPILVQPANDTSSTEYWGNIPVPLSQFTSPLPPNTPTLPLPFADCRASGWDPL